MTTGKPAGPPFAFGLCADDYALTPGVSRGILEALDAGVLTATSVMTTSPWWPDESAALARFAGRADIGLHLNLTLGAPLAPMPRLAPTGQLPGVSDLLRLARRAKFPFDEVSVEIERQMDRFEAILGRQPDHIDGHQHIQVIAPVRRSIFAALRRRGWTPWLRASGDNPIRIIRRRACVKKALGLAILSREVRSSAFAEALAVNDGFAGFSSFRTEDDYGRLFGRYLIAPGARHLVMCHPGYIDDELRQLDPVVESREQELAFLLSSRFADTLARAGARLTRISKMPVPIRAGAPSQTD